MKALVGTVNKGTMKLRKGLLTALCDQGRAGRHVLQLSTDSREPDPEFILPRIPGTVPGGRNAPPRPQTGQSTTVLHHTWVGIRAGNGSLRSSNFDNHGQHPSY